MKKLNLLLSLLVAINALHASNNVELDTLADQLEQIVSLRPSTKTVLNGKKVSPEAQSIVAPKQTIYKTACHYVSGLFAKHLSPFSVAVVEYSPTASISPDSLASSSPCESRFGSGDLEANNTEKPIVPVFVEAESNRQKLRRLLYEYAIYDSVEELDELIKSVKYHVYAAGLRSFLNERDGYQKTALYYAAEHSSWLSVLKLLQARAAVGDKEFGIIKKNLTLFNLVNDDRQLDALNGAFKIADWLDLSIESLVNSKDESGKTPLHHAAEKGCFKIAYVLIYANKSAGCYVTEIDSTDLFGRTALHYAAKRGLKDPIVQRLLQAGASEDIRDHDGKMPRDYAFEAQEK